MISVTDPGSDLRSESIKKFSDHVVAYKQFPQGILATIFSDESCVCMNNKNIIPYEHFTDFLFRGRGLVPAKLQPSLKRVR